MATKQTQEAKSKKQIYYVVEAFYDRLNHKAYMIGDVYRETSEKRTAALAEAKKTGFNKYGRVFISTKKPEGK